MAQYALPTSDISKVAHECAGDADADAFDELDEGFGAGRGSGSGPDDATTHWNHDSGEINCGLSSVTDPTASTGHIIRARIAKSNGCPLASGGKQIDNTITLRQSGTQKATSTLTALGGTAWETHSYTLSSSEADSITDYGALELESTYAGVGGGATRDMNTSTLEFECPDAAPSVIPPPDPTVRMDALHRSYSW